MSSNLWAFIFWGVSVASATEPQPLISPLIEFPSNKQIVFLKSHENLKLPLRWNEVTGATTYRYEVSDKEDFKNILINQDSSARSGSVDSSTLVESNYYVRVKAVQSELESSWSPVIEFSFLRVP